jgi:hypothetical protein
MALLELQQALRSTGLDAEISGGHVVFPYKVPVGDHVGTTVRIGLIGADFPVNPPGGVHVSPGLGSGWMYWSRPYPDWASSARDIEEYLAFLRQLFAQFARATV